jgi:F-type H+-transporting ATPase subunit gamma
MELVASSKLRRAKERQERCRPYFTELRNTLDEIEATTNDFSSPYHANRTVKKACLIVIAGDRGLAGGYNSNVFRKAEEFLTQEAVDTCILPIGKRALDFFRRRGYEILTEEFAEVGLLSVSDSFVLSSFIAKGYLEEKYDRVSLIYTKFISLLTQTPDSASLLPLEAGHLQNEQKKSIEPLVLYKPGPNTVYNAIVPNYLAGMVYGAICESVASELGARRTAMDAASKNAAEMIEDLNLHYNRARQGAITQEITEIVAGAEH